MSIPPRCQLSEEELIFDIEKLKWVTIPCTSGMEIEQYEGDIRMCRKLMTEYTWQYDGSGPLETALPPSIAPYKEISKFVSLVIDEGCIWEWKGYYTRGPEPAPEFSEFGCGSHLHLRPRPSILHQKIDASKPESQRVPGLQNDPPYEHPEHITLSDVWATTYNTLVEVCPWILPLFCAGKSYSMNVFGFRKKVMYWAKLTHYRYSPETMEREYLRPDYYGHPYTAVALDRKDREHILTIELRLNEAHPSISYVTLLILNRIIRKCYERNYLSPLLDLRPDQRETLYTMLVDAINYSAYRYVNLYDTLEETVNEFVQTYGPIRFVQGREIPRLKREYDSYFKLFKDILYNYTHWMNPIEYRVYQLFANKGNPRRNWRQLWYLLTTPKGEFYWEEPYITGL